MNGQKVIAAEFAVSISILTWGATRQGFWPWPATVARTAFAFAILSLLGLLNEQLAALLGAGFLLAQILKTPVDANGNFKFTGGIPPANEVAYPLLDIPGVIKDSKAKRPNQKWAPGTGASNKGAELPITDKKTTGNGGIVSV